MTNQEIQELSKALAEVLTEGNTEGTQYGVVVIAVQARTVPGSFKGGEEKIEFIQPITFIEGSVVERCAMIRAIMEDIPMAFYPMVKESLIMAQKDRMEWELANEPNGVTPTETEIETPESALVDNEIVTKIKSFVYGKTQFKDGKDRTEGGIILPPGFN